MKKTIDDIFSSLEFLAPEKEFKIIYAPNRKWISELNGNRNQKHFFIKSDSNLFLYSFYPCSYYCKKTGEYVEKIFKWLKKFPDTRNFIEEKLKLETRVLMFIKVLN